MCRNSSTATSQVTELAVSSVSAGASHQNDQFIILCCCIIVLVAAHEEKTGNSTSRREFKRSVDVPTDVQVCSYVSNTRRQQIKIHGVVKY